jgi:hypothetical protein
LIGDIGIRILLRIPVRPPNSGDKSHENEDEKPAPMTHHWFTGKIRARLAPTF